MQISATQIATAAPLCPSCGHETAAGHRACSACGYGFEFAARLLPYEAPDLRKFIDRDGYLTRDDIRRGQHALENLREYFPQVTLCTCLARVPEEVSITEFGFWLFNQSVPNGPRLVERRLHSILLCIDPQRGEAGLTVGYGLDPFIDDASLEACLAKIQKPLRASHYGKALTKLCQALRPVLTQGFDQASQAYSRLLSERKRQEHRVRQQAFSANPLPPKPRTADQTNSHV